MSLRDILGLSREEELPEVEEEVDHTPPPQYATVDQMQQMVSSVMNQMQENFVNLTNGNNQRREEPQQQYQQQIHEPTLEEINEALEEGDNKKFLQLQAQRDMVREQRYQNQLYQLQQAGQREFDTINSQLLETSMPEYKKYQADVDKHVKELGLSKAQATNPMIAKLLLNAVRGEKLDEIYAERAEAAKRQANDAATGHPTGNRNNPMHTEPKQVFSDNAEAAIRFLGHDKETFAKKRGYADWAAYESNAADYQEAKKGAGTYVPKWRRNKK